MDECGDNKRFHSLIKRYQSNNARDKAKDEFLLSSRSLLTNNNVPNEYEWERQTLKGDKRSWAGLATALVSP